MCRSHFSFLFLFSFFSVAFLFLFFTHFVHCVFSCLSVCISLCLCLVCCSWLPSLILLLHSVLLQILQPLLFSIAPRPPSSTSLPPATATTTTNTLHFHTSLCRPFFLSLSSILLRTCFLPRFLSFPLPPPLPLLPSLPPPFLPHSRLFFFFFLPLLLNDFPLALPFLPLWRPWIQYFMVTQKISEPHLVWGLTVWLHFGCLVH